MSSLNYIYFWLGFESIDFIAKMSVGSRVWKVWRPSITYLKPELFAISSHSDQPTLNTIWSWFLIRLFIFFNWFAACFGVLYRAFARLFFHKCKLLCCTLLKPLSPLLSLECACINLARQKKGLNVLATLYNTNYKYGASTLYLRAFCVKSGFCRI